MYCVFASEPSQDPNTLSPAEEIISGLRTIPEFRSWRLEACHSEEQLYSLDRPDVIVLSKLFSKNMLNVFKHLPLAQPHSRFVVLAGEMSVKTRTFVRMAEDNGFTNIVTGPLPPGDRPYTLLVALKHDKYELEGGTPPMPREVEEREIIIQSPAPEAPVCVADQIAADTQPQVDPVVPVQQVQLNPEKKKVRFVRSSVRKAQPGITEESAAPVQVITLENLEVAESKPVPVQFEESYNRMGVLITSSSNKGGVGKTTAAETLSVGLSRAHIPTCLVDMDFGGPNIAPFFKLNCKYGIEYLSKLPVSAINPQTLKDVLVKVNEYLFVVPGPIDKSWPYFSKEQISKIISVLRKMFQVVVVDTPQQFWTREFLEPVFDSSDLVLCLVDQSVYSESETAAYAPKLLFYGVTPERIRIVLNRFSPKLHNAKIIEKYFNASFKNDVPKDKLPRVTVTIPENYEENILKGYKGEVVLDEHLNQWKPLFTEIAHLAGCDYKFGTAQEEKKGLLGSFKGLFSRKGK